MSTQKSNQVTGKQHGADDLSRYDLERAYADALLDRVDTAQQDIRDIQGDMSLLDTMKNALDLISENMGRMRRIAQGVQQDDATDCDRSVAGDEILNLMMVNMLIVEETEFNDHLLFKNDVISLCSFAGGEVTLTTTSIPEISGIETGDFQAILDGVDNAARTINRQYQRIGTVMRTLLDTYGQLQSEVGLLLNAQTQQGK